MTLLMPATRKPRLVIAGQMPPPWGGQNVMIARILDECRASTDFETEHLAFHFTPDFKNVRRGSAAKLAELAKVVARLIALRRRGPIDLLLFPAGGPQNVPIVRDLLLLPWVLLLTRRVVVQFHAAGIADRFAEKRGALFHLLAALYRRCFGAIVMTAFNRRDPEIFHIPRIAVLPHRLTDEFDPLLVRRDAAQRRLLYVGHLCREKGTPDLLRAFAAIAPEDPRLVLELVGEPLPPMDDANLRASAQELGIADRVIFSGVLTGRAKQEAFARADLFVFPTVAPYESFGLVLVEAMMWDLPIVATDWRGNRDVLGSEFDGDCFTIAPELSASLAAALRRQLAKPAKTKGNRDLFLARYRHDPRHPDYPKLLTDLLSEKSA